MLYKDFSALTYIIVSLILFPFAKLIFDVIIRFKLKAIIEQQSFTIYIVYPLLFIFSLYVAPIGILLLLIKALYTYLKNS